MTKKEEAASNAAENGRAEEAASIMGDLRGENEALRTALDESLYYEVRAWRMLYETQHLRFAPSTEEEET